MSNLGDMLRQKYSPEATAGDTTSTTEIATNTETTSEVPTNGDSQPGVFGQFFDRFKENADAAGYMVARSVLGPAVDNAITAAQTAPQGRTSAMGQIVTDRGTLGLVDSLAGGQAQTAALLSGSSPDEAQAAGEEARANVNEGFQETRAEYPGSSMVGDMVGSVAVGGPALKAGQAVFGAGSYFFAPAAAAAGDEFVYQLNSDASLSEAATAAGTAGLVGGIGSKVFQGAGVGYRLFRGKGKPALEREVGEEIYRAVSDSMQIQTGKTPTPSEVMAAIEAVPSEQLISDVFPGLQRKLFLLGSSTDDNVQQRVLGLLAARNNLRSQNDVIMKSVSSPSKPRSAYAFGKYADEVQKKLRPQYDDLFNRMDEAQWAQEVPTIRDSITKLMDGDLSTAGEDISTLMRLVDEATPRNNISFRELNQLRKNIGNEIYRRIRSNNSAGNNKVEPIKNLQTAQRYIRDILRTNDEFASLQRKYGDIEEARNAYEFGQKLVRSGKMEGADADIFLQGSQGGLSAEALAEGTRRAIFDKAKYGSPTANQIKPGLADDLRAILGDEPVDTMLANIDDLKRMEGSVEALMKGRDAVTDPSTTFAGQRFMDVQVTAEGITGGASGVAPMFAARRVLDAIKNPAAKPLAGELNRRLAAQSDALLTQGGAGAQEAVANYLRGPVVQAAQRGGVAAGRAMTEAEAPVTSAVQGAAGATTDALQEFFINELMNR